MLSKSWCVALAVLALAAFDVQSVFAAGGGGHGSHAGGGCHGSHAGGLAAARWRAGYGGGYGYPGWGYSPFGFGYELGDVPYFAQFPPVYFGYDDNIPILKTPVWSSWTGSENPQPDMGSAAPARPPRPPLRIINPYYFEGRAGEL